MLAGERHTVIYNLLRRDGAVKIADLKSVLKVSEMTIRRDLDDLESRNLLKRVHGGAITVGDRPGEMSFAVQSRVEVEKKLAIARAAAELVRDGMHVAIDGSSTGLEFARLLKDFTGITIVTNSLGIIWEFHNLPSVNLLVLGGSVAIDSNSLDGTFAIENARQLFVDVFFFSCAGFDEEEITNSSPVASEIRKTLLGNAQRTVLLADSTKYGRKGFIKLFGWSDVDVLITDAGLSDEARDAIRQVAPHLEIIRA